MHFDNLADLVTQAKNCTRCGLCQYRTQVVCGEGDDNARVMFIGEGPGQREDELGRPFVGAAGKFLDELITVAGFLRQEVYIANVVKCRPPQNRDPYPEEITACRDYLNEQIRLINPQIIVTLGRFSMAMFFDKDLISAIHGIPKRVGRVVYYPMYHPAAALYNGSMREVLLKDAKKIPLIIKKLNKMEQEGFFAKEELENEQRKFEQENLQKALEIAPSGFKVVDADVAVTLHNTQEKDIIAKTDSSENNLNGGQLPLF
ncbi:MAG: uracil-DNA glycosylase [Chloroflexi bacterium]|nr:uracil-DNA glycosylase [Chloroflexota bacterium]